LGKVDADIDLRATPPSASLPVDYFTLNARHGVVAAPYAAVAATCARLREVPFATRAHFRLYLPLWLMLAKVDLDTC
jgi:hypothetical protein